MAVVKSPFMSLDARGSVSGLTASFVRGGNVMKGKANPGTKFEPGQNKARSVLGFLSRQWGELTTGERDSWDAWAIDHPGTDKFGDPFIMSGFNAYVMLNHTAIRIAEVGEGYDLPPEDPPVASISVLNAETGAGNAGEVDLTWSEVGTGEANDWWEIQVAGPFQSAGRKSVEARFKYVQKVAGNVALDTVADLDEGFWYWFRVRYVESHGQISAWHVKQATPKLTI